MLKNILNLNGAQQLSKNEQKSVNGGGLIGIELGGASCNSPIICESDGECGPGRCWIPVGQIQGCCQIFKL